MIAAPPATYLIDKSKRVAATYVGVVNKDDVEANISRSLAERWEFDPMPAHNVAGLRRSAAGDVVAIQ